MVTLELPKSRQQNFRLQIFKKCKVQAHQDLHWLQIQLFSSLVLKDINLYLVPDLYGSDVALWET